MKQQSDAEIAGQVAGNPIVLDQKSHTTVQSFIAASNRKLLHVDTIVPWAQDVDVSKPPKLEETSWIYGTIQWRGLSPAQRTELLWLETARDVSYCIWQEQAFAEMYIGYVNRYHSSLSSDIREYLVISSREELVHTLMFRRYLHVAKLPIWSHPKTIPRFPAFAKRTINQHPVYGILWNLLVKWHTDLNAMYQTQHALVDPLTRAIFKEHHAEETRHIAFAKMIVENFFTTAHAGEANALREFIKRAFGIFLHEITFMPEIARLTSFAFPVAIDDHKNIQDIRNSPNNLRINRERFRDVHEWCMKYKLLP